MLLNRIKTLTNCIEKKRLMGTKESAVIQPLTSHLTNHLSKTKNISRQRCKEKDKFRSEFLVWTIHMDVVVLDEQLELTDISSLQIVDLVGMNCWERLMIGTDEEIESRKSGLSERFNDDDDLFSIKSREEYYGQNHIRCLVLT